MLKPLRSHLMAPTNNNHMPPHVGPSVSMIEEEKKVKHCVGEIRTPLAIVKE